MKTSGKLKVFLQLLVVSLLITAVSAFGGNKWMMEKNAKELLLINEQLIEELAVVEENGEVEISGRVVMHGGRPVLQLDTIRQIPAESQTLQGMSEPALTAGSYKVFIREESLDEVPVAKEP